MGIPPSENVERPAVPYEMKNLSTSRLIEEGPPVLPTGPIEADAASGRQRSEDKAKNWKCSAVEQPDFRPRQVCQTAP
jgi:hypothetical protein